MASKIEKFECDVDRNQRPPEKKLLFAILERAIMDLVVVAEKTIKKKEIFSGQSVAALSAIAWIKSNNCLGINSYSVICAILNIDPSWLRDPKILAKVIEYYGKKKNDLSKDRPRKRNVRLYSGIQE